MRRAHAKQRWICVSILLRVCIIWLQTDSQTSWKVEIESKASIAATPNQKRMIDHRTIPVCTVSIKHLNIWQFQHKVKYLWSHSSNHYPLWISFNSRHFAYCLRPSSVGVCFLPFRLGRSGEKQDIIWTLGCFCVTFTIERTMPEIRNLHIEKRASLAHYSDSAYEYGSVIITQNQPLQSQALRIHTDIFGQWVEIQGPENKPHFCAKHTL